jgi:hypothetical protein
MRPKARGLEQHGGPSGWLEESDPAGCEFVRYTLRTVHAACPDGPHHLPRSVADLLLNLLYTNTKHRHELRHAWKAWPGTLIDPCLLFGQSHDPNHGEGKDEEAKKDTQPLAYEGRESAVVGPVHVNSPRGGGGV